MPLLAADGGAQSLLLPGLLILMVVGLFYVQSRQRKKVQAQQSAMRSSLSIGTSVTMVSGLKGTVARIDDMGDTVGIEIAPGVIVTFLARAIAESSDAAQTRAQTQDDPSSDGGDSTADGPITER